MLKIINYKSMKINQEFKDSYQTKELCSKSPKHGGCPTKPLTSCESPHLHQTQKVRILVPIFFWVLGGQHCKEPKYSYQQKLRNLFYHNKILLNGLCGRNVYTCTLQDAYVYDVQSVHMHDVDDVHEYVKLVSFETRTTIQNG